jgi:2-amino-4-hydroxy-6-hydroxymethyldihydropteridine diphosphokinase
VKSLDGSISLPPWTTAYLGLGSNLGDRQANLSAALERLERSPSVRLQRCSSLYESAPVGVLDQPWFLNAVAEIGTGLAPLELLALLKSIERELGRQPGRRWGERLVDLDLLLYGDLELATDVLTVPHPELWRRLFVLAPLQELAPELRTPNGRSIGQRVTELGQTQQVRPVLPSASACSGS